MQLAAERTPKGYYAEIEAKRFSVSDLYEILSVWFPRTAAHVATRGGFAHVVPQDPVMDIVGQFYIKLSQDEKDRWDAVFVDHGSMAVRAESVGMSPRSLYRWKDALMEKLADELP